MIKRLFSRFEAFLVIETVSQKKAFGLAFLSLLIPGRIRYLFIFILISRLLPHEVNTKKIRMILSLPFKRPEIFVFSYITGLFLVYSAALIGDSFFFGRSDISLFYSYMIFYSAYFGILMLVTTKGADNITFPVFLLITDLVAGSIGTVESNPYSLISPLFQKDPLLSGFLSFLILAVSFVVFVVDRREKW
jgi:hypothetical protein